MDNLRFYNTTVDLNALFYKSHKEIIKRVAQELGSHERVDELTQKFLGDELKLKKHKDPNQPKKPRTGFILFCDENRPILKKSQPDLKMGQVMKELGRLWSECSDEQKEVYNSKYRTSKEQYEDDLDEYKLNNY